MTLCAPGQLLWKTDAQLVALARSGSDAAFAQIALRYRRSLLRHCRSVLRDERAEDAVQQTLVRALIALRSGAEVRELSPWLHRIARNAALDEVRARGFDHVELNDELADVRSTDEVERRARFRDAVSAIAALPDRQRSAVVRTAGGESPAEIAVGLGISETAARQLLHRARVSLRAVVQALIPPPLVWLGKRTGGILTRVSGSGTVAPLVPKVAAVVIATTATAAIVPIQIPGFSHGSAPRAQGTRDAALGQNARAGGSAPGSAGGTVGASLTSSWTGSSAVGKQPADGHGPTGGRVPAGHAGMVSSAGGGSAPAATSSTPSGVPAERAAANSEPAPGAPQADASPAATGSDQTGVDPATNDPTATDAAAGDANATPTDTPATDTTPSDATPAGATPTDATATGSLSGH
jgi:RNA polymerase sigma factor (sigma-70 family)